MPGSRTATALGESRREQKMNLKDEFSRLTDRATWAGRGVAFRAKVEATKAVWFPPKSAGKAMKAPAAAKKATKKTAKKTAKKATGTAKKATSNA
jgi:hypothetical protein